MAIEVKELIIKMTVVDKAPAKQMLNAGMNAAEKKQFMNECIHKILEKLESKVER